MLLAFPRRGFGLPAWDSPNVALITITDGNCCFIDDLYN